MEAELESLNVTKICRTCLSVEEPLVDVFDRSEIHSEAKLTIADLLAAIAYLQMSSGDGLPEEICQSCLEKAVIAYNFKLLCERSDALLRKVSFAHSSKWNDALLQDSIVPSNSLMLIKPQIRVDSKFKDSNDKSNDDKLLSDNFNDVTVDFHLNTEAEELNLFQISSNKIEKNFIEIEPDSFVNKINDKEECFVSPMDTFKCEICLQSFSQLETLEDHKKMHSSSSHHHCHLCGKSFTRLSSLHLHLVKHTEYKAHLCQICGERFHLAGGLRQHLKYHRGIKPHTCELCEKRYYNLHLLKEHIRCAHSNNRYNNACSICNKRFTAKSTLKMHMKIHTGERAHACETCGKKFTRATYLRAHRRKHTLEPPPQVFLCSYENCGRMFTAKASLNIHIRHKHTQERSYECEHCKKAFCSLQGLHDHRRIHTGEKPEGCSVCGNRFVNKQSLKKHMRLHTGERPYSCEHCGECFVSSSRRAEHVQTKHMERQHACAVCHKRFHLRRTLLGHMRIHSGEKRSHSKSVPPPVVSNIPIVSDSKQNVPEPGFEVIV